MTNVKAQIPNECQMTNAKKRPLEVIEILNLLEVWTKKRELITDYIGKQFVIGILDFI